MDIHRIATTACATTLLLATGAVHAQSALSFADIPGVNARPTVQIDLNEAMLAFVSAAAKAADPAATAALAGISNVRVYVYEGIGDDDLSAVMDFVNDTSGALERDGWHSAVRVEEDGEQVRIYMKPAAPGPNVPAASLSGLTVMVTDSASDEAVFIDIAGIIDPARIGQIAGAAGVGDLLSTVPGLGAPSP